MAKFFKLLFALLSVTILLSTTCIDDNNKQIKFTNRSDDNLFIRVEYYYYEHLKNLYDRPVLVGADQTALFEFPTYDWNIDELWCSVVIVYPKTQNKYTITEINDRKLYDDQLIISPSELKAHDNTIYYYGKEHNETD